MNIPKLLTYILLIILSCQKDKIESIKSITDIVTVEPQKAEYNVGDTVWFSNHSTNYLVEKTSNDTFLKQDGDILHYANFLIPSSDLNQSMNHIFTEPINGSDYSKIITNFKDNSASFTVQYGCNTNNKNHFRYGIILREKGIFVLHPGTTGTDRFSNQFQTTTSCSQYTNHSFFVIEPNLEFLLQFNQEINAHLLKEIKEEDQIQTYYERLTNAKLIYWIKVK